MKYEAQLRTWALEKALAYQLPAYGEKSLEEFADQLYRYAYSPDLDLLDSFKHALALLGEVGNARDIIKEMAFLLEQAQHQLGISVVTFSPVEQPVAGSAQLVEQH